MEPLDHKMGTGSERDEARRESTPSGEVPVPILLDPNLKINCELVTAILTRFIASELGRAGFERAVVGLSGGIDSSVVTFLAARALGPKNVLAVTMPYKTSSDATRSDSQVVIEALGVQTVDVPISDQVDAYFGRFPNASQLRRANKCARERMTVLYDQSAAFGALVLGTSNKSELLLGYGTQFGDMASAINPIGDVYKTQLYQLAAWLGVPEAILGKAPTGDLWVGQTDEGELGFSYAEVDRLLVRMVDARLRRVDLIAEGFPAEFIDRVATIVRRNHYKRRMPVIAKLSQRTMDRDFRYARDWGT
jgi:NAD+ synthase